MKVDIDDFIIIRVMKNNSSINPEMFHSKRVGKINPGEKTTKCLIFGRRMLTSKRRTGFEGEIDINNDSPTVSLKIGAAVLNTYFEENVISKYTPDELEEKLILLTNVDILYKKNSNVITTIRKSSVQE